MGQKCGPELLSAALTTAYVYKYYVYMNVTLSIEDDVMREARRRAEAMGTSVNQIVRDYLARFAGVTDVDDLAGEFERLSRTSKGRSRGWKFNREELHERR
jgi:hypothetical protein